MRILRETLAIHKQPVIWAPHREGTFIGGPLDETLTDEIIVIRGS
jgi:hypothetical protein